MGALETSNRIGRDEMEEGSGGCFAPVVHLDGTPGTPDAPSGPGILGEKTFEEGLDQIETVEGNCKS